MRILNRYVIREVAESFIFGLMVFSGILLLDQLFQLMNLLLGKGVHILTVLKLFGLALPNIFSLTIPMAVLLAILLSFGRFSEDNEITALRSAGLKFKTVTRPVVLCAVLLSACLVLFNQYISPSTQKEFRGMYREILSQRPLVKFEEKIITSLSDYKLYVEHINKQDNSLQRLNIYKFAPNENGMPWRITATSATVELQGNAVVFNLFNGFWQQPNPAKPQNLVHLNFHTYVFAIDMDNKNTAFGQSLREMNARELLAEIQTYRQKQMPTNFLETEFWMRNVLAAAPLVFALIAIPLGLILEKGGKGIGFGISLIVIFVYYILLVSGINLSEKGFAPPYIIMWLPDVITTIFAAYLWRIMLKK
jgi:lipopolysaccharide export system permease protein